MHAADQCDTKKGKSQWNGEPWNYMASSPMKGLKEKDIYVYMLMWITHCEVHCENEKRITVS